MPRILQSLKSHAHWGHLRLYAACLCLLLLGRFCTFESPRCSPELKSADSVAWLAALAPTRHCPAYPALAGQALRNAFTAVIGNIGSKMSDILGSHESTHCNRTKPVNTRPPLRRNSPKAITDGISVPFLCSPGRGTPSQEMWRWPVSTYRLRACS